MDFQQVLSIFQFVLFSYGGSPITLGQLLMVPCILALTWFVVSRLGRLIRAALTARHVSPDAVHLFSRLYLVITLSIVAITGLELLNIPLTAFAFVSGAIAIGVGFGAQNIINNFISGWILMWERPIRIGDFLEVSDARGVVESINTRSTLIRRNDGVHMLVPNSQLLENTVTNWTLIDNNARSTVRVGVAYGVDVVLVAKLIRQVLDEQKAILKHPPAAVVFEDFGDNALIFDAIFWICAQSEMDLRMTRSNIRFRIYAIFAEHGIVIAYPQRDVHLDGQLTLIKPTSDRATHQQNGNKPQ